MLSFFFIEMVLALSLSFLFFIICQWGLNRNSPLTNWPFVGMVPVLLRNAGRIHEFVAEVLKKVGNTFSFKGPWFSDMNFIITCDPMNVHHILSVNFANYPKGAELRRIMDAFGDGIFNADDDLWRSQRKIFHSLINHKSFESTFKKVIKEKLQKGLLPILEHVSKAQIDIDMEDVFQRFTFDNICVLVLGFDPYCLSVDFPRVAYETAFDVVEEVILHRHIVPQSFWQLQKWLNIGEEKKLRMALETFDRFLYDCISSKREKLYAQKIDAKMEEKEQGHGLLAHFMAEEGILKEYDELLDKNSDKFLRDMAFNLLAAGRDTIGASLSWFIWLVSTHPMIEEKIHEEIDDKLKMRKDDEEEWLSDTPHLDKLVYLHAALCETLRLFPPVPINHKTAIQPDILPSGHRVDKNTKVLISFYAMGRTKEIWGEDCLEFKPERWISEKGSIKHVPSYKFTAFNAGPRACLGKDISFIEMKMVAIAIFWNYQVRVLEGQNVSPSDSMVLHMKHGLKVRVVKRNV